MKERCDREMAAALLLVLLGRTMGEVSCKYGEKDNHSDYTSDYKMQKSEFQIFIATNVATTEFKVQKT